MFADVLIDISHSDIDRVFEYEMPAGLQVSIGWRVLVPFGRGNAPKEGFVIDTKEVSGSERAEIKSILRRLEDYPALLPEQIELARWICETYYCTMASALRLMIPAQIRGARVSEKKASAVRLLLDPAGIEKAKDSLRTKEGIVRAPAQAALLDILGNDWQMLISDAVSLVPSAREAIKALEKKGWAETGDVVLRRKPYSEIKGLSQDQKLTDEQQTAVDAITESLSKGGVQVLHGITGSGKTEVYMHCIAKCLNKSKKAIVLVPEISLTPQTVFRFRGRFGDSVAVLHSRLSVGERFDEWRRIVQGDVDVVVGARSAVFAPLKDIGLIVIDEEHEMSYLSESHPRYSAIDVAKKRCEDSKGVLVLGSATPSVDTYFKCVRGKYNLLELNERPTSQSLPKVHVVDMRDELLKGNRSIFSSAMYNGLKKCIDDGNQAMLFMNRRGYSTFVMCRGCGYVMHCDHCDVSMTFHKYGNAAKCHYCGDFKTIPELCPECGKPYLRQFGIGTQQVEEQALNLFPDIRVLRMDMDTTGGKESHNKILESFGKGEAQVLVGTQMIAKGLDFARVTMVGVISADSMLHLPDYRSAERTFQLITQVAGRAGRGEDPGEVIVQSYTPEHYSITFAAKQDYKAFFEKELWLRRAAIFPPFALFFRVILSGEDEDKVVKACMELGNGLECYAKEHIKDKLLFYSATPAPIKRIKNKFRYQILLKFKDSVKLRSVLGNMHAIVKGKSEGGVYMDVEINPMNML